MSVDQRAMMRSVSLGSTSSASAAAARNRAQRVNEEPVTAVRTGNRPTTTYRVEDGVRKLDAGRQGSATNNSTSERIQSTSALLERIRNHVNQIASQGYWSDTDWKTYEYNMAQAASQLVETQALQLYGTVSYLSANDGKPLMAGIDLSFLKEHWEVVAAVGGVLLLVKYIKGKSNQEPA